MTIAHLPELPPHLHLITSELATFGANHPDLHCYLMLDPLLDRTILDAVLAEARPRVQAYRCECPVLRDNLQLCPRLLELQPDRHANVIALALRYALHEQEKRSLTRGFSVCGILFSRAKGDRTARYLGAQTDVYNPILIERSFFSFFDRRVLPMLPAILTSAQWQHLLGPVTHWFHIDRDARLAHLSNSAVPHEQPSHWEKDSIRYVPLDFSNEQWNKLARIEWINSTLDRWQENHANAPDSTLPDITIESIDDLLQQAAYYGITRKKDAVTFALHGLRTHPAFHQHPLLQPILADVAEGAGYDAQSERLDEIDWKEIIRDCEHDASRY